MRKIGVICYDDSTQTAADLASYVRDNSPAEWVVVQHSREADAMSAILEDDTNSYLRIVTPEEDGEDSMSNYATGKALAKNCDRLVAMWDWREPRVMSAVTQARLWGKEVVINPWDNGGVIHPTPEPSSHPRMCSKCVNARSLGASNECDCQDSGSSSSG